MAAILIDNKASIKAATKSGFTPLHIAAKYGKINVTKILLKKESNIDAQGKVRHLLIKLCVYNYPNFSEIFISKF